MKWQPIKTAPKDGTEVLAYCADFHPVPIAMHYTSREYLAKEYGDPDYMEAGWYTSCAYPESMPEVPREPTHWMHLPPPPRAKDRKN